MVPQRLFFAVFALGTVISFAGCGMSGSAGQNPLNEQSPTPSSVVFVSSPPTSMAVNASVTIFAATTYTEAGSSENTAVTYSLSCGSSNACGAFSASDEGGAVVYTAPAAIPSGNTVTVKATSVANPSLSASATITIVPPIPISVSFYGAVPASMGVGTSVPLGALIQNDVSANPQVQWSVSCGGTACGSFNRTTTTSSGTVTYTAPAAIPPGNSVTVTITSVTDPTKSASATIAMTAAGPVMADGRYVFQISGSAESAGEFVTGVFDAKGGAITDGEQDLVSDDGAGDLTSQVQQITGGSYAATPSGNLQINIEAGYSAETLTGVLASGSNAFVSGIGGIPGNGILQLQTAVAAPSGGYAISLFGDDTYNSPVWIDGVLNVDGPGTISGNGTVLDVIGSYAPGQTSSPALAASTVSAPDAYGRVVFQLNPGANSTLPVLYLAGYMADSAHIWLSQASNPMQDDVYGGISGGVALGQGAATGSYTAASVAGTSYVFGAQGSDMHGPLQLAGVLVLNADGTVGGVLNWNDLTGNSTQAPVDFTGSYTVDSEGRVTLSNLTDGSTFDYSFHLYLSASGGGLILSSDDNDEFSGQAFEQQASAFTAASFSGAYGLDASAFSISSSDLTNWGNAVGSIAVTTNGATDAVAGYVDFNDSPADFAASGSFTPATDGVFEGTLAGFASETPQSPNTFTLYLVDGTQGVGIETDATQLTLFRVGTQ